MSIKRFRKLLARKRWRMLTERRRARQAVMAYPTAQPMIELMEPRLLLSSVIVVDSTLDVVDANDGVTTLREAILLANSTPNTNGPDEIHFDIPGLDPGEAAIIYITSALPEITEAVIIDGTTQSGYNGTPLIELQGDEVTHMSGLTLSNHEGSTIRGLSIHGFKKSGIEITNSPWYQNGHTIEDNYIGLDASGEDGLANGAGISVYRSIGTIIRNNVISNSKNSGIELSSATYTVIQGNLIGTDATGTVAMGNVKHGILLNDWYVHHTQIGGSDTGEGNVISGNECGIFLANETYENVIQGNYIGTDITGTVAIGNTYGIGFGTIAYHTAGKQNLVGGSGEGEGNIISGNTDAGILNIGDDNVFQGNRIGVDANGDALGNGGSGIESYGDNNLFGGLDEGEGNIIAHNGGYGIRLVSEGVGNSILGNSIYDNGTEQVDPTLGLGIKIGGSSTLIENDDDDVDTGANNQQNHPHILGATATSSGITIDGMLSSTPQTTFLIEFFASPASDPGRYDQGKIFLGRAEVTTDIDGDVYFTETFEVNVPVGYVITATATAPDGSTSEFSRSDANATVVPGNTPPSNLVVSVDEDTIIENGSVLLTISFDDDDLGDEHTVTIDWGDGDIDTVTLTNDERTLNIGHQYLEDSGNGSYTIDVTVTDSEDGSVVGDTSVTVENAAPVASAISGPEEVEVGDTATFSASFTDEGTLDTHTTSWVITDANDNIVASGSGLSINFTPAAEGSYTVTFTVTDDDGDSDTETFTFDAIIITSASDLQLSLSQSQITENGSVTLSLVFQDPDLDDEHTVTIDWGDGNVDIVTLPIGDRSYNIAHQYLDDKDGVDGVYTISVTVEDKDGSVSDTIDVTVQNAAPVIGSLTGPSTVLRGETATFTASFSDVGTLDNHTTSWVVKDSSNNVVATGSGLTLNFSTMNLGTYTVTFTVTDDSGGSDSQSLSVTVKAWAIRMDDVTGANTLFVLGGNGNDNIELKQITTYTFTLKLNSVTETITSTNPVIEHIVVYGNDGDDTITILDVTDLRTEVYGGAGNDVIVGGDYQNILVGGDGNDTISGGRRDLIIGGHGSDTLYGGERQDVLVAGATLWDNNRVALWAIMSEIVYSGHDYPTRVKHLRNGTGLTNGYALNASTIVDNHIDTVLGQAERDYFIVSTGDTTDKKSDETRDFV